MLSRVPIRAGSHRLALVLGLAALLVAPAGAVSPPWAQQQRLIASNGAANDIFGYSAAISGSTAVIGAMQTNNGKGAVYVFVRSAGVWNLQQELTPAGGTAGYHFGAAISVSEDTTLIGGASSSTGSPNQQGAVWVFARSGGVWSQMQELTASDGTANDGFGSSVSVSGDTAVIGAYNRNMAQGVAYVFVRSGGIWSQQQELTASNGATGDRFGNSVSVSGNTAVIGADYKAVNSDLLQGAAYVYIESGGVWTQQQELTASAGAAGDRFGVSVSTSGDVAVIGAHNRNMAQGAAYVFVRSGGIWSQQNELAASNGATLDHFGISVSVSGRTAVIGAYYKTVSSNLLQGAAYVFAQNGDVWTQQQELIASGGAVGDRFGVSVSASGDTVMIGASGTTINSMSNQGAAYAFVVTQPTITGVRVSGGGSNIAQNAWVEIYGAGLAPTSPAGGLTWSGASSFASGQMPTELQGVSVAVNGRPAYISFISSTQVNVLTPLDSTTGPVAITLNDGTTTSAAFMANLQALAPGFLRLGDGVNIAALHADYSYLGPASMSMPGYSFTPAKPGETILLFGDGFGLPATSLTAGSEFQSGTLPNLPQVAIGGAAATVNFAGLIGPGLYQINVVVPSTAANGANQVIATYGGASSPTGAMISVSR